MQRRHASAIVLIMLLCLPEGVIDMVRLHPALGCCLQISDEEEAMLPGIEAGVAHQAMKEGQEEQDFDDDDVPILQQVLFEATLVRLSLRLANHSDDRFSPCIMVLQHQDLQPMKCLLVCKCLLCPVSQRM